MRKLLLALALLCFATPAFAQNTQCSNRPAGESTNACANTRFVTSAIAALPPVAGFITCAANQFVNVVGASSVCAQPSFSNLSGQATLAQLPTQTANTVLGSIAGGAPIDLTQTQLTSLINAFTTSLSGAVPASGGGTTNFLRADGTFANPGSASGLPRGYISGYTHSNDVTLPNTVLDFTTGTARDSTNAQNITIASAFTKSTAAWAVGTGNGCFETGTTVANNTWYYTYAILRTDLASSDYVCSLSPSSPNLTGGGLTSYSFFRRIGSFKTAAASTNIVAFTQVNDRWYWAAAIREGGGSTLCVVAPTLTASLTVPRIQGTIILFNSLYFGTPGASEGLVFAPGFSPAVSTGADGYSMIQNVNNLGAAGQYAIAVDSSARLSFSCDSAGAAIIFNIYTKGWIDIL